MITEEHGVYKWEAEKYARLLEHTQNAYLKNHQEVEQKYLLGIERPFSKTFIDVSAGYGRLLPMMAKIAGRVIAIENNRSMLGELRKRAAQFSNVEVIEGDGNSLSDLLSGKIISQPVILLTQNSLGTWEGDRKRLLEEMKKIAERERRSCNISV